MANREDPDFLPCVSEAVERDEASRAEGDHELTDIGVDPTPCERVLREQGDRRRDRTHGPLGRRRILPPEEIEALLQVIERAPCVDYRRHGFGRAAREPFASLCIQACTSSAR